MYKAYYGLTRNPFDISPDPYFYFQTGKHNEALANLYYGVSRRKGFVVVTGEVGTGKTLLLRCLLDIFNRNQIAFAYIFNPHLTVDQFLHYIVADFGLGRNARSKTEILFTLNHFLIERHRRNAATVLVIDEAHHLSSEVLEEVRLLTNLETSQQKLLQIILVGQPELDTKLDSMDLRQLKQRVSLRCKLEPLSPEQTAAYIQRRLELSGGKAIGDKLFPAQTVAAVYRYSQGIPRLINTICENALLLAYVNQTMSVTKAMVEEASADLRIQPPVEPMPVRAKVADVGPVFKTGEPLSTVYEPKVSVSHKEVKLSEGMSRK